jgi:micrococcal nuclease
VSLRAPLALLLIGLALWALAAPAAAAPPPLTPGGTAELGAVLDGTTLTLRDGRILRLAGIETPNPARRGEAALAAREKAELARLAAGATLELRSAGSATDRHGRVPAQLFAGGIWVQGELVEAGLARVQGSADERLGLIELMAAEARARAARLGIWRLPFYAVRGAENAAADAGSFQLVEGTVVDAARVEGGVYVNFGPDWRTAFSLHIGRDALKLCRAAGLDPMALAGARLRVRGFIDGSRRPTIEMSFPEQIERL